MMTGWAYLTLTIILGVAGSVCAKMSMGLTAVIPTVLLFVFHISAFLTSALAFKYLNFSVAYTAWCGGGIVLTTLIGVIAFQESITPSKAFFLGLIVLSIAGLSFEPQEQIELKEEEVVNGSYYRTSSNY